MRQNKTKQQILYSIYDIHYLSFIWQELCNYHLDYHSSINKCTTGLVDGLFCEIIVWIIQYIWLKICQYCMQDWHTGSLSPYYVTANTQHVYLVLGNRPVIDVGINIIAIICDTDV